ncbi:hypothetical protein GCM10029976_011720 [Kribbella albertanoniae]|uniref:Peptidyl-prolyl cis-trans isomerase n=1 Tax=Kribbella albertanoniae TaxID=1266829 RepID=A0A4R4PM37_9ACTN|nr:hypothetical protein [Kribbella albertanoniae]TDC23078.1 hypothetical protein E1261_29345 [Kribbella albertanoniae]
MRIVRLVLLGAIVGALSPACAAAPAPVADGIESPFAVVATVNGDPVTAGELGREMARGSGTPEQVRAAALQRLTEIKVQQALLRTKGISNDTSYTGFLRQLDEENQRRAEARRNGAPIYGPASFTEAQYFRYRFDTDVVQLKQQLAGRDLPTSEKQLRKYYASVRARLFSRGSRLTIDTVTSTYAGRTATPVTRDRAEAAIKTVEARLRDGATLSAAAGSAGLAVRRIVVNAGGASSTGLRSDPLAAIGSGLAPGRTAPIADLGDRFVLVSCVATEPLAPVTFEAAHERVRTLYLDHSYRALVQRLAKQAKVTVEPSQ